MKYIVFTGVLLMPAVALAAPRTVQELAALTVDYLNAGIGVALAAAIAIYFFGVATAIPKLKTDDSERLRAHFVWGIIALFVMFSVWGILAVLRNTLFGGGGLDPLDGGGTQVGCASLEECVFGGGVAK